MLFLITQTHTPETCPKEKGGMKNLYAENVLGLALKAVYAIHAAHRIYYIVEADSYKAIAKFWSPECYGAPRK